MSDMDVSLRLRLVNQLSKPAEEAERDLKELQQAAERLGRAKGGAELAGDLNKLGRSATEAKGKISAVEDEANKLRTAIGRVDQDALSGLKTNAQGAKRALSEVGNEAVELKNKLGRVDDNAFAGVKSDAKQAEEAIRGIGRAADDTKEKLNGLNRQGNGHAGPLHDQSGAGPTNRRRFAGDAATAAAERLGIDSVVPVGAGAAYAVGGTIAAGATVAGAAINAAGNDEYASDQLRTLGGYNEEEQARIDKFLSRIGRKRGLGAQGAMGVYGRLMAGGLSADNAKAMTDAAIVFAKATGADPEDAANTTVALKNNMGIDAKDMPAAYDSMGLGGTEGSFEVKDMARNYPEILALMSGLGSKGVPGVQVATAISQSVTKRAGTPDQAATAFSAMLNDLVAPEVTDRAKKYGIDVFGTIDKAKAGGTDPVLALVDIIRSKLGNDPEKMSELFRNTTSKLAINAAVEDYPEILAMIERMKKSAGTIDKGYEQNTDNLNSQRDRLTANVGQEAKDAVAPLLPLLTSVARNLSTYLENRDGSKSESIFETLQRMMPGMWPVYPILKDGSTIMQGGKPSWAEPVTNANAAAEQSLGQFFERLFGLGKPDPKSGSEKKVEPREGTYQPFKGLSNLRSEMDQNLTEPAESSMGSYNAALSAGLEQAIRMAQSSANAMQSALSFTARPTVEPVIVQPTGSGDASSATPAGQRHSSVSSSNNIKVTQNIYSPNSKVAALRAQREADRSVRMAQSRAFSDMGPRTA